LQLREEFFCQFFVTKMAKFLRYFQHKISSLVAGMIIFVNYQKNVVEPNTIL